MNCRRVEPLLSKHLEGLLPAREAQKVASHLAECRTCRRLRDELAALAAELRELPRLPLSPETPRRIAGTWMAERETTTPRWRRGFLALSPPTPSLWSPLAAAALVVLALALAWWGHGKANEVSSFHVAQRPPRDRMTPAPSALPPRVSQTDRRFARAHSAPPNASPRSQPSLRPDAAGSSEKKRGRQHSKPMGVDLARHDRDPLVNAAGGSPAPTDAWDTVERRVRRAVPVRDDFVQIAFPRIASISDRQMAAAIESYKREADIVDPRLSREVTLQQKSTALSDLCERLRGDTGIQLGAGPSVADEKVTVFCEKLPLRDVMRQLSRPFSYAWLRGKKEGGEYRYELVQDLRSQLLEEELRNRDRNAALLVLESEIERFRPYLDLSPDEALARAKTAAARDKPLLEKLAGSGWGPLHLYFRLSPQELASLRAGQELAFSQGQYFTPKPGEQPLSTELARGVLHSFRDLRVRKADEIPEFYPVDIAAPDNPPLTADPEVRARITLKLKQSELGQFTLEGTSGVYFPRGAGTDDSPGPLAIGMSPTLLKPNNHLADARWGNDPSLRPRVNVQPRSACRQNVPSNPSSEGREVSEPKTTTADVLEALHRATGLPIISDSYTRLFKLGSVSVKNQPLFEALDHLSDGMRLRWNKDGEWLQFRSTSYYDDRLKEVPNRLLARWAAARQRQRALTLDDLVEIAQLSDAQLDGNEVAEGAAGCWGLTEWDLARNRNLRPHLRFLAGFTPAQRQEAMSAEGLPFARMSLPLQQQFVSNAFLSHPLFPPLQSLEELTGATLRVDYTQPGWFQWGNPDLVWHWSRWVVVVEPGRDGHWLPRPSVRERTREAVMQAVRHIDPKLREAAVHTARHLRAQPLQEPPVPLEEQIYPSQLGLAFIYIPGASNARPIHTVNRGGDSWQLLW
jgi:hypothetical protein